MSKINAQAMRPYSQHQAKLLATKLSLRQQADSIDKLSHAIASARVDLNPHQVDAALLAVRNPLSKGGAPLHPYGSSFEIQIDQFSQLTWHW